jgi:hypothetical protein
MKKHKRTMYGDVLMEYEKDRGTYLINVDFARIVRRFRCKMLAKQYFDKFDGILIMR